MTQIATETATTQVVAPAKGLTMMVLKNPLYAECANGGISERVDKVTLVGVRDETTDRKVKPLPEHSRVFAPSEIAPPVVLVKRRMGSRTLWHVEPLVTGESKPWFMAGGSFVETSDSRVSALTEGFYGAFSLHDRSEG
jgi:hypothetical protein